MHKKQLTFVLMAISISLTGLFAGWTVAWLTSETKTIKNVFSVGSVQVQLKETFNTDKNGDGDPDCWEGVLVPGTILDKNPVITVPEECEDSWVFVHLQETAWPNEKKISYAVEDGWNLLPDSANVYFRGVNRKALNRTFHVLKLDSIEVGADLKKQELATIEQPKLTLAAYAIQQAGFDSPIEAWKHVCPTP